MFDAILHPAVLVFLIPIVAIICGTVIKLQKLYAFSLSIRFSLSS